MSITVWMTVINIGVGAIFAFAGSYLGSYFASKKATVEAEEEVRDGT